MRLALAAVIALGARACGGAQPDSAATSAAPGPSARAPSTPPGPIVTPIDPPPQPFEPTAFGVKVAGTGRPVILIPGLGCPGSVWDETVAHLAKTGAQTHVLTLAGFAGRVPLPAGQPLIATARAELARYIRERHLVHPVVIGHSLGGFAALWLAASEPDLVGPVVVVDSGALLGDGNEDSARKARDMWATTTDAAMKLELRALFAGMANNQRRLEPVIQAVQRSDRRAIADAFYELTRTDLRALMASVRAPVRLILADGPFKNDLAASVDTVPHHDVRVIANTRHFVMFDDPAKFEAALDEFLEANP